MSSISIHHPEVSAALATHRDAHTTALDALTPVAAGEGVPADVMASISQLLIRGRAIHENAIGLGQQGEAANKTLEQTDENNGTRFEGGE